MFHDVTTTKFWFDLSPFPITYSLYFGTGVHMALSGTHFPCVKCHTDVPWRSNSHFTQSILAGLVLRSHLVSILFFYFSLFFLVHHVFCQGILPSVWRACITQGWYERLIYLLQKVSAVWKPLNHTTNMFFGIWLLSSPLPSPLPVLIIFLFISFRPFSLNMYYPFNLFPLHILEKGTMSWRCRTHLALFN
jgi:hypothetical protein